jgi:hypothetical protein
MLYKVSHNQMVIQQNLNQKARNTQMHLKFNNRYPETTGPWQALKNWGAKGEHKTTRDHDK